MKEYDNTHYNEIDDSTTKVVKVSNANGDDAETYKKIANIQRVADFLTALEDYPCWDMSSLYLDFIEQGKVTTKELMDYVEDLNAIVDSMVKAIKTSRDR